MLEEYTAAHSEKVEDILEWDMDKFEAFYKAFKLRSVRKDLEHHKSLEIHALKCNGNVSGDQLTEAIRSTEEMYNGIISSLDEPVDDGIDRDALMSHPMFANVNYVKIDDGIAEEYKKM